MEETLTEQMDVWTLEKILTNPDRFEWRIGDKKKKRRIESSLQLFGTFGMLDAQSASKTSLLVLMICPA